MIISPSFDVFEKNHVAGKNQLAWVRFAADLDTPVSLMLKLGAAQKDTFILESVTGGETRGRYSVIGLKPDLIWKCSGHQSYLNRQAQSNPDAFETLAGHPLQNLRDLIAKSNIDMPEGLPPVSAGLFGYLGYDMIRLVEDLPNMNPDPVEVPDALMMRPSLLAVLDGAKGEVTLLAPIWLSSDITARDAYNNATSRLHKALEALEHNLRDSRNLESSATVAEPLKPTSNFTKDGYKEAVSKAKEYIRRGDIFQVVPSQRWQLPFTLPAFSLYRSLRRTNPSPFMFYFNFGDFQVIGASPEILVRLREGEVTIRPIAGTRPRGKTPREDQELEADLLADEKELAEHLMLLDLGRNDVGRVCKAGSVRPTEKFIIERYSHVMHIVSNVVGEIKENHDGLSALLAGLPAGTVSGAPKVRAMEIIDELEPEKRGIYGGGVGYFAATGEMDFCIALRTAVLKDEVLYIQAGGGVIYDSDPEAEWLETVNKSKALRQAAQDASFFMHDTDS